MFYSKVTNKKISLDTVEKIMGMGAGISPMACQNGTPNALDFQLVSVLGHIMKKDIPMTIISNDKGYCCLESFWKNKGYMVSVRKPKDICQRKEQNEQIDAGGVDKLIKQMQDSDEIERIIKGSKSKCEFACNLSKYFRDSKKASGVYNKFKPFLKSMFTS